MRSTELLLLAVAVSATVLVAGCGGNESLDGSVVSMEGLTAEPVELEGAVGRGRTRIEELVRLRDEAGKIKGYAAVAVVRSKSGRFPIRVRLDESGCVESAEVLSYPYDRGSGVILPTFTGQFEGRCSPEQLTMGQEIQAVTGATVSCGAMAEGVIDVMSMVRKIKSQR
ncbi:hypothetical protein STSP2_00531 [Anaerohalosphaera lusitana]|uniref:Uncharacterized protein n=1 Tax=Anaerohalosphaera lusitana TaxID=1936003 RepID=A0A1U9NHZ9_9BACT|nr:FMN-binding protein [Anaerohalosphaera lusitana]AQT67387.1 hypothetical protein STSP2_00531 [Anaerohalosphaera lusitana]